MHKAIHVLTGLYVKEWWKFCLSITIWKNHYSDVRDTRTQLRASDLVDRTRPVDSRILVPLGACY